MTKKLEATRADLKVYDTISQNYKDSVKPRRVGMEWTDVSELSRAWMMLMGDFSPTARPEDKMLKGYIACEEGEDGRTYYDSGELRELAAACTEVADWLDKLAALHKAGG